ncbi:hypothetical protein M5K25_012272 [Dendrobium thyrsiflorum]|uniref:Uncharacterized protein n=1 Tax=Dendrobium thyrsiflorum TaxID=117978 RepID=A0ABD0UWM0_DENTH
MDRLLQSQQFDLRIIIADALQPLVSWNNNLAAASRRLDPVLSDQWPDERLKSKPSCVHKNRTSPDTGQGGTGLGHKISKIFKASNSFHSLDLDSKKQKTKLEESAVSFAWLHHRSPFATENQDGKNVRLAEPVGPWTASDLASFTRFFSYHLRMEGKFAVMEEMLKKLLEVKTAPATSEARETISSHERRGNPNIFRGRENPEVEILECEDGMPPLEPLSREEMSTGFERMAADFVGRREDFYRRGAESKRRGEFDEGVGKKIRMKREPWIEKKNVEDRD